MLEMSENGEREIVHVWQGTLPYSSRIETDRMNFW